MTGEEVLGSGTDSFDDYQTAAERTTPPLADVSIVERLLCAALGATGEAGEFADLVKKWVFHEHPLSPDKLIEELGDQLWYIALASTALGVPMSEIARRNLDKLARRYPDGFDSKRSINREVSP